MQTGHVTTTPDERGGSPAEERRREPGPAPRAEPPPGGLAAKEDTGQAEESLTDRYAQLRASGLACDRW